MFREVIEQTANYMTMVKERDLTPEHFLGKSLVITLGGDGCFLRASS